MRAHKHANPALVISPPVCLTHMRLRTDLLGDGVLGAAAAQGRHKHKLLHTLLHGRLDHVDVSLLGAHPE